MNKILKMICLLITASVLLSGCSSSDEESYNKQAMMNKMLEVSVYFCEGLTLPDEDSSDSSGTLDEKYEVSDDYIAVDSDIEKEYLDNEESWKDECGEIYTSTIMSVTEEDFTFSETSGEITLSYEMPATTRNVKVTATFEEDPENYDIMTMTSFSIEPVYTMGEKLAKAGANTITGMLTVFAVLIFISLIIYLFKYIPIIEEKFSKKDDRPETENFGSSSRQDEKGNDEVLAEEEKGDEELIAVITAAIAASEGKSGDSFVVRSIRRRK